MYVCTYVRMYVCTYACMYVCMYVYADLWEQFKQFNLLLFYFKNITLVAISLIYCLRIAHMLLL